MSRFLSLSHLCRLSHLSRRARTFPAVFPLLGQSWKMPAVDSGSFIDEPQPTTKHQTLRNQKILELLMNGSHLTGTPDKRWFLQLQILSFQTATGAPPNAAKRSYIRECDDSDDHSYHHAITPAEEAVVSHPPSNSQWVHSLGLEPLDRTSTKKTPFRRSKCQRKFWWHQDVIITTFYNIGQLRSTVLQIR